MTWNGERKVVFVDPDDAHVLFWWPALVVPKHEYDIFNDRMMDGCLPTIKSDEILVCYFEDASL
jgi:hypothetical protein